MKVDTGLTFRGYPIWLGPRDIDQKLPDKLVLTQLDRFVREHFPALAKLIVSDDGTIVRGAIPLKKGGN